ncbi:MAG: isocitrate lyase/PEP mutase family protein [Rhodospirillales bacterium]|nr:isocitrate lyase/PEP mutase family protein [Rhodospirillales bacterium]
MQPTPPLQPAAAARTAFRAVLAGPRMIHPGSVFDPLSARAAADLGFEVLMFAGSIASLAILGAPDLVAITLTEFAEQCRRITRAVAMPAGTSNPPLLVDADHGYGNAHGVARTVGELEAAGVAAMTLEDTDLPTSHGTTGLVLLPLEAGLGKLRAALAARTDPGFAIVARTSALAATDAEDALARCRAYAAAGADALFLAGADSREDVAAIHQATGLPIILGGSRAEARAEDGVRIALQGHQPAMAAVRAAWETLAHLRAGLPPSALTNQPDAQLVRRLTRADAYAKAGRDFLGL